jgi:hypothetical protein
MSLHDMVRAVRSACTCSQQSQAGPAADANPDATQQQQTEGTLSALPSSVAREIDVSHLPPPLPMVRILETLRELGPGETLLVRHTRRPIHLYPKLEALGCQHETTEPAPGKIEVRITNPATRPS